MTTVRTLLLVALAIGIAAVVPMGNGWGQAIAGFAVLFLLCGAVVSHRQRKARRILGE